VAELTALQAATQLAISSRSSTSARRATDCSTATSRARADPAGDHAREADEGLRRLMPLAEAPWGALVVESVLDRLEVSGIRSATRPATTPSGASGRTTRWTPSRSSATTRRCSRAARSRSSGRTERRRQAGDLARLPEQMIVQYREGSRRHRVAAAAALGDEDDAPSTRRSTGGGIYKFRKATAEDGRRVGGDAARGCRAKSPAAMSRGRSRTHSNVVPVVEIGVNRGSSPGQWGHARGEFEHVLGSSTASTC
jgi:hypothetical protein